MAREGDDIFGTLIYVVVAVVIAFLAITWLSKQLTKLGTGGGGSGAGGAASTPQSPFSKMLGGFGVTSPLQNLANIIQAWQPTVNSSLASLLNQNNAAIDSGVNWQNTLTQELGGIQSPSSLNFSMPPDLTSSFDSSQLQNLMDAGNSLSTTSDSTYY